MTPVDLAFPFVTTTVNGLQAVNMCATAVFKNGQWTINYTSAARSFFLVYKQTNLFLRNTGIVIRQVAPSTSTSFYNDLVVTSTIITPTASIRTRSTTGTFTPNFVLGSKLSANAPQPNQIINPTLWGVNASSVSTSLNKLYMNNVSVSPLTTVNLCTGLDSTATFNAPLAGQLSLIFCELLMYDGELTATDLTNIVTYLTTRWGIPVT